MEEEQNYKEKTKVFGFGYVKFEMPIICPMVVYVVGYIRLEFRQVCAGVLTLGLISKQMVFEAMGMCDITQGKKVDRKRRTMTKS